MVAEPPGGAAAPWARLVVARPRRSSACPLRLPRHACGPAVQPALRAPYGTGRLGRRRQYDDPAGAIPAARLHAGLLGTAYTAPARSRARWRSSLAQRRPAPG